MSAGADRNKIKLAGGWLLGERWNDDPQPMAEAKPTKADRARTVIEMGVRLQAEQDDFSGPDGWQEIESGGCVNGGLHKRDAAGWCMLCTDFVPALADIPKASNF
ncbi:hypothetical protein B7R21_09875 [Subtercola boreus]|uniref:Uncharacterized protein n=1 Tax=Subtercola boreus TaxID=120213 RepID=A0A3E0VSN2_9MICO|nr:hypothetical protein [Subtercola boreus]RFA12645.1 hypothetical protein B7R21_09875 [Subtercola boreus]